MDHCPSWSRPWPTCRSCGRCRRRSSGHDPRSTRRSSPSSRTPSKRAAVGDVAWFHDFVRSVFLHRRKYLRHVLAGIWPDRWTKMEVDAWLESRGYQRPDPCRGPRYRGVSRDGPCAARTMGHASRQRRDGLGRRAARSCSVITDPGPIYAEGVRTFLDLGGKILGRGWRSPLADRLSLNKNPTRSVSLFQIAASSPRAVFGVGPCPGDRSLQLCPNRYRGSRPWISRRKTITYRFWRPTLRGRNS